MKRPTKRDLQKIATRLGYKGLKSFSDMYIGGTWNAFGNINNSVSTLTIHLDPNHLVRCIEVNYTYFSITDAVKKLNGYIATNGNQPHIKLLELLTP